jgi:hypothetical protein
MTLSPVFRSQEAVRVLRTHGVWSRIESAASGQFDAIAVVTGDLSETLDAAYLEPDAPAAAPGARTVPLEFVQEYFFLIFFRSILQTLGVTGADLALCAELNFCIKGTITAADNIFDDQEKRLLPLRAGDGARFNAILHLLVFQRLTGLALARGIAAGSITDAAAHRVQRELLSRMAAIGALEGSEERGVREVLAPETMIERVHRIRGGALFELAFIAPRLLAHPIDRDRLARAQHAVARLGTAFQIVDDLTDFEVDLARGTHNLLVSQITHLGTAEERACLRSFAADTDDVVAELFADSARAVLQRGEEEALAALQELAALGFWFPPSLSADLVRAIVGMDGVARMRRLSLESGVAAGTPPDGV